MATKNEFTSLVSHLGKNSDLYTRARKPGSSNEFRSESLSSVGTFHGGIHFGSSSDNRVAHPQESFSWSHLLRQTASGGLSSAFGGGLLSSFGGLGGIVSGIVSLFGNHRKTPPPLTLFRLPESENQTVYVHSSPGQSTPSAGIYNVSHAPPAQYHSAYIAQAVKHAILTSSSLNDVIAEI